MTSEESGYTYLLHGQGSDSRLANHQTTPPKKGKATFIWVRYARSFQPTSSYSEVPPSPSPSTHLKNHTGSLTFTKNSKTLHKHQDRSTTKMPRKRKAEEQADEKKPRKQNKRARSVAGKMQIKRTGQYTPIYTKIHHFNLECRQEGYQILYTGVCSDEVRVTPSRRRDGPSK